MAMDNEKREVFTRVLEEVLEQLAFMFGKVVDKEEIFTENEKYLHVTMEFKGAQTGDVGIAISAWLGVVLASNILGIDEGEEVALDKSADALKELLNIVCGQLLTTVYGEEPVFDLTVPELVALDKVEWMNLVDSPETIVMMVEGVPMVAHASF